MHHIVHVHTYIYGAYFVSAHYLFTAVWTYRLYIVFSQFPGNLLEETLIGHALGCAPILLQAFLMIHSKTFCTSGISQGYFARYGEPAQQRRGEHAGVHLGTRRVVGGW